MQTEWNFVLSKKLRITNIHMDTVQQETPDLHDQILWTLRLGLILVLVLMPLILVLVPIPSLALLPALERHPVLGRMAPYFWGSWAVLSIWVILTKGLPHVIGQRDDFLGLVWLFLGFTNLFAAMICLCLL
jgi:hypothetical protein